MKRIPKSQRSDALDEVGELLSREIFEHLSQSKSPVEGGAYRSQLTKDYKKIKSKISGSSSANLELYGDMLDSLEYKINEDNLSVEVGIFDEEQAQKAYGHNTGFRGHPTIKGSKYKREFIPKTKQNFKKDILKGVEEILKSYASED